MGTIRRAVGAKRRNARIRLACLFCATTLLVGSSAWAQDPAAEPAAPEAMPEPAATPEPEPLPAEPAPAVEQRGPHTANSLQLGVGFRYGKMLSDGELDPWGSGLGLDVGYTLPNAIYLGANFEYFFGTELVGPPNVNSNLWQFSVEGGYDVGLGDNFVIRPKVGVGVAGVKVAVEECPLDLSCQNSNSAKAAIAPGARFMLFTSKISLALDFRYDIVLTDPSLKALIFSFGIGF